MKILPNRLHHRLLLIFLVPALVVLINLRYSTSVTVSFLPNLGDVGEVAVAVDEEQDAKKGSLLYPYSDEYAQIITWQVDPKQFMFDEIPYWQWCRWRNARENDRQSIPIRESWKTYWRNSTVFDLYSNELDIRNITFIPKSSTKIKVLFQIQFDCYETMKNSPYGTGNWVQLIYLLRLGAAATASQGQQFPVDVDFKMTCRDPRNKLQAHQSSLVMPWLLGHFSSVEVHKYLEHYWNHKENYDCMPGGWGNAPVGWMIPFIRYDLRRMAVALVGLPTEDLAHPAHRWSEERETALQSSYLARPLISSSTPLLSNITLDDVAIHFRCGDIMGANNVIFRFLKFKEYSSRIHPSVESIGIVTQPFGMSKNQNGQVRFRDQNDAVGVSICRSVVHRFVDYLQERFPKARVSIHNGPKETVALAYARLIMAKKQAFAFPDSSFSIFPVLASFGTGHQLLPVAPPYSPVMTNEWIHQIQSELLQIDSKTNYRDGRLRFMNISTEDALYARQTFEMRAENETKAAIDIVEWFVNDTLQFPINISKK
jgi:hypothetical protein